MEQNRKRCIMNLFRKKKMLVFYIILDFFYPKGLRWFLSLIATYLYAGQNGNKITQTLTEIKHEILNEIRAMTRNITGGTRTVKGLEISKKLVRFSFLYPLLFYSIEPTIHVLYTGPNCTNIGQQLVKMKEEILEEIKAIKTNKTGGRRLKG